MTETDKTESMGCLIIIGGFIISLVIGVAVGSIWVVIIILLMTMFVGGMMIAAGQQEAAKEAETKIKEFRNEIRNEYDKIKQDADIPDNYKIVTCIKESAIMLKGKQYLWVKDQKIYLFPREESIDKINTIRNDIYSRIRLFYIPLDKIEYFATRGEIVYENKISGGGGGGSSIKGAIVGGALAGEAGAIIGSRKKSDPIKSELIKHDKRETFINFYDGNDEKMSIFLKYGDYNVLNDIIPEKAFEIINAIKTNTTLNKVLKENNSLSISEELRELAKLKEEGILTEEEFLEKKKILLDKIN